jgi:hypothetical protein
MGEKVRKGFRKVNVTNTVHRNVNGKNIPVETILGMWE